MTKSNKPQMTLLSKSIKVGFTDAEGKKYCPTHEVKIPTSLARYEGDLLDLFKSGIGDDYLLTKIVKRAHFEARRGWWDEESQSRKDVMNGNPLRDLINLFGMKDCPAMLKPLKAKVKKFLKEYCLVEVKDDGTVTFKPEPEGLFEIINNPNLTVLTAKYTAAKKEPKTVYEKVDELLTKLAGSKSLAEDATAMAYIAAMQKASADWLKASKQLDGKAE